MSTPMIGACLSRRWPRWDEADLRAEVHILRRSRRTWIAARLAALKSPRTPARRDVAESRRRFFTAGPRARWDDLFEILKRIAAPER
jgi:hypothetical protein